MMDGIIAQVEASQFAQKIPLKWEISFEYFLDMVPRNAKPFKLEGDWIRTEPGGTREETSVRTRLIWLEFAASSVTQRLELTIIYWQMTEVWEQVEVMPIQALEEKGHHQTWARVCVYGLDGRGKKAKKGYL